MDVVIPIVFPDYLIGVNTPPIAIQVPDLLPRIDLFPNVLRIAATKNKVRELGHAGGLIINGGSGLTKYYEYGRYDRASLGLTRRVPVPDVKMSGGRPTSQSLSNTLRTVSKSAGQGGRVSAAYIEVPEGKFNAMLTYCQKRITENSNPKRTPYGLTDNSCVHFMKELIEAGGIATPWMLDPRPNSYIEELRVEFPALDYDPGKQVTIEGIELKGPAGSVKPVPVRR